MKQRNDAGIDNPLLDKVEETGDKEEDCGTARAFLGNVKHTLQKSTKNAHKTKRKKDAEKRKMALEKSRASTTEASHEAQTIEASNEAQTIEASNEVIESESETGTCTNTEEVPIESQNEGNTYEEVEQRQEGQASSSETEILQNGNEEQSLPRPDNDMMVNESNNVMVGESNNENVQNARGSIQRKRSRTGENEDMDKTIKGGLNQVDRFGIGQTMRDLQSVIKKLKRAGPTGGETGTEVDEIFNNLALQVVDMTSTMLNIQEEKAALMEQLIAIQQTKMRTTITDVQGGSTLSYLQTAQKGLAKAVATGTCLPPPVLPEVTKHVPAEHVILYKAEVKGELPTKMAQEEFRKNFKLIIGDEIMNEVSAIRATRWGGYTIILRSERSRDAAMEKLTSSQEHMQDDKQKQRIIAPKKKVAKIVCREPPIGWSHSQILREMYGKHNPLLFQLNALDRQAKIFETRLGWVFELSTNEAAAVEGQGNRIRYGHAREMKVEEFIPLQQCYRCCLFGHSAKECTAIHEHCRLCGKQGHSGKDCLQKDNKEAWRCANCIWNNINRGTNLPVGHAAAQLHKCAIAQNEKAIRKSQLATAGVFTAPQKHFVPKENSDSQISTTSPITNERKEGKNTQTSSFSSTTVQGQNTRRRQPSVKLARCYVPPSDSSASSSSKTIVPKKGHEAIQIRPTVLPGTKYSQSQLGGRGSSRSVSGRGRGRETFDRRGGTNSHDAGSQIDSTSSSASHTQHPRSVTEANTSQIDSEMGGDSGT